MIVNNADPTPDDWYWFHYDGLGSVAALSNNSGTIVETYSYDVFGQPSASSSVNNPYLFTARRYDDETDLYYRARMYNPEIGRFLQPDPIGYDDGMNMYTYVGNNPASFVDPMGLCKGNYSRLDNLKMAKNELNHYVN